MIKVENFKNNKIKNKYLFTLYKLNNNKIRSYFKSCKTSRALCIVINDDCPAGITIIGVLDILCFAS